MRDELTRPLIMPLKMLQSCAYKGKICTRHLTTHHHLPAVSNVSNTILTESRKGSFPYAHKRYSGRYSGVF